MSIHIDREAAPWRCLPLKRKAEDSRRKKNQEFADEFSRCRRLSEGIFSRKCTNIIDHPGPKLRQLIAHGDASVSSFTKTNREKPGCHSAIAWLFRGVQMGPVASRVSQMDD